MPLTTQWRKEMFEENDMILVFSMSMKYKAGSTRASYVEEEEETDADSIYGTGIPKAGPFSNPEDRDAVWKEMYETSVEIIPNERKYLKMGMVGMDPSIYARNRISNE
ncbi:uncharacterized protein [Anabrus simplex]|uniref:uncharacterized protein isoform X1 n=1 Tax=Anabrus simplex TaxID=316456 RepID=UPI0035A3C6BA